MLPGCEAVTAVCVVICCTPAINCEQIINPLCAQANCPESKSELEDDLSQSAGVGLCALVSAGFLLFINCPLVEQDE